MAIIEWQAQRETFNPEKNYFEIDHINVSRETSEEEDRLSRNAERCANCGAALGMLGVLFGLFGGPVFGLFEIWWACITALVCSITSIIIGFCILLNKSTAYNEALARYVKEHDVWNTPEVQEIERYNKEQNAFAAKWRAEHPLEEKIRACLLDPKSSVDVANLARYYAEVYIKEKENERSENS